MIGQETLVKKLLSFTVDSFPRALILVGKKGSGRHTLCKLIREKYGLDLVHSTDSLCDIVYPTQLVVDSDECREKDIQSLLKVLEEPLPCLFTVFICETLSTIPSTISSRCIVETLKEYSKEELVAITKAESDSFQLKYCSTPGQIFQFNEESVREAVSLCRTIVDKITLANIPNILSITKKIKYKPEEEGIDFELFKQVMFAVSTAKVVEERDKRYFSLWKSTSQLYSDSTIHNVDRKKLLEHYLLSIRGLLNEN